MKVMSPQYPRFLLGLVVLVFVVSIRPAMAGEENKQQATPSMAKVFLKPLSKPIEVTGEVVDAWCYASQTVGEGRGEKHKECAIYCARGGVTLGILEDSTNLMYIAGKHKAYQGCQKLLLPYVGKHVVVKGWVGDKGGCRVLKIMDVKLVGK